MQHIQLLQRKTIEKELGKLNTEELLLVLQQVKNLEKNIRESNLDIIFRLVEYREHHYRLLAQYSS